MVIVTSVGELTLYDSVTNMNSGMQPGVTVHPKIVQLPHPTGGCMALQNNTASKVPVHAIETMRIIQALLLSLSILIRIWSQKSSHEWD